MTTVEADLNGDTVDAPALLKKHLTSVLRLQDGIDSLELMLDDAKKAVAGGGNQAARDHVDRLLVTHGDLSTEAEALYASLNVHSEFPQLEGMSFDFVNTLLMARELKINLRQRLVGRFFEVSRLDQAAGGRDVALGMVPFPGVNVVRD